MPTYQRALEKHLDRYRREFLGVPTAGVFHYRGRDVVRGHILPRDLRWLNIPEPFRRSIREHVRSHRAIRLHRYFHHLNSSQAFALSLFLPFYTHAPKALAAALGASDVKSLRLEAVPLRKEGTNVDVCWRDRAGDVTYCEVKLSELEFGTTVADAPHLKKLNTTYGPVLRQHLAPAALEPTSFFAAYQVFRYLYLAARLKNARVVFLLPQSNETLITQLREALRTVRSDLRQRVDVRYVEDLLKRLASPDRDNGLTWYAALLQAKYVPVAS
jgi:hypothetical protein